MNVFDLQGKASLDVTPYVNGVKEATQSNEALMKNMDVLTKLVSSLEYNMRKVSHTADDVADSLRKESSETQKEGDASEEAADETKKLGNEIKTTGDHSEKATSKIKDLAGALKDGLVTGAKLAAGAVTAASVGVSALVKEAVGEYSEYEQLVGGVNKLFGEASAQVQENAQNAYATTGMSANEYMEQVTGFAASLIQATGRGAQQDIDELQDALDEEYTLTKQTLADEYDAVKENWNERIKASKAAKDGEADLLTKQRDEELKGLKRANEEKLKVLKQHNKDVVAEAERANNQSETTYESLEKAADLADVAMRAISDNVNTFGTDMSSVQNAFQGFAKQNYTMLDNLRLGYGGTKAEMERLIEDANEYAEANGMAADLTINSFADIVTAIDLIQKKQGIANTTIEEAGKTITGSLGAAKAAWKNLTIEMAKENGNVEQAFNILSESLNGVITNMLPKVEQALGGVGTLITNAAPQIIKGVNNLLPKVLPSILKSAASIVSAASQSLLEATPIFLDMGKNMLANLAEGIEKADLDIGNSAIVKVFGSIADNVPEYLHYAERILANLGNALINADHAELGRKIGSMITSGINSITDLLADLDMQKVGKNIADFVNAMPWKEIAESIINLLGAAIGSLGEIAAGFFEDADLGSLMTAIGVLSGPKLLGGIKDYIGSPEGKELGSAAGESWSSTFMAGIKAFGLGWAIGSYLRDNIVIGDKTLGEWVEAGAEKLFGEIPDESEFDDASNTGYINYNGKVIKVDPNSQVYKTYNPSGYNEWLQNEATNGEYYTEHLVPRVEGDVAGQPANNLQARPATKHNTETFKYYANGQLQTAFKYDEYNQLSEAWKKYGKYKVGARGTVVTQPTPAIIGEAGAEALVPLENHTEWIDKVADGIAARTGGNTNYITFNVNIDGTGKNAEEIADEAIEVISTKLDILGIQQQRAVGGKSWA